MRLRILVPTDYSKNATNAISYAINIAVTIGAEIFLAHFRKLPVLPPHVYGDLYEDVIKNEDERNLSEFEEYRTTVYNPLNNALGNVPTQFICKLADFEEGVNDIVNNEKIDLIIMGTKGATGLKKVIMGSNTAKLIKSMICPVLAIPEGAIFQGLATIVFATDFHKMNNRKSLLPMMQYAQLFNAEILFFYIKFKKEKIDFNQLVGSQIEIDSMTFNIKHSYHFYEKDNIVEGINEFIETYNAQMLVIVPKKHDLFERFFTKSLSLEMAYQTHVPLLALPASEEA
jgi:nucleotide-binding universal stress UspA family protein